MENKKKCKELNKILLILLCLMLFGIPNISSSMQTLGTYQLDKDVLLIQTCDNCTYVNISSVIYPNGTVALSNVVMTKDDTYYYYTFNKTNVLGRYIVNTYGDLDTEKTASSYDFYITNTGFSLSTPQSIAYIVIISFLLLFFIGLVYGSIKIRWSSPRNEEGAIIGKNELKYVKILMIGGSYFVFMALNFFIYAITNSLEIYSNFSGFFYMIYYAQLIGLTLFAPLLVFFGLVAFFQNKKINNALQRGIPIK